MEFVSRLKNLKSGIWLLYKQYISPLNRQGYGRIGKHSVIKNNTIINQQNVYVDDYCVIQDQQNFISYKGKLKVGRFSVISSGCTIVPGAHKLTVGVPFYLATMNHINDDEGDIVIDEDCWIGAGCILLPKVHIGRGAVVGAGSVVTKDIPPYAVVVGAPARIVATKFTLDQVLRHESILYPVEKRMTKYDLEVLFSNKYSGLRSIGVEVLDSKGLKDIEKVREESGITNYSLEY